MTSWCSSARTVRTNACADQWRLPLRSSINLSWSTLCTPAIQFIVSWLPSKLIWSYSHLIAWCCLVWLRPVLRTFFICASWVIFSVVAIAALPWTHWGLLCCCISARSTLDEAPAIWLNLDSIIPGWGVCGAMTCGCGKGKEDDSKKWKVLRNTSAKGDYVTGSLW